jgi:hypothetical protein
MTRLADQNERKRLGGEATGYRDAEINRPLPAENLPEQNERSRREA